jgi:hypothetical protein
LGGLDALDNIIRLLPQLLMLCRRISVILQGLTSPWGASFICILRPRTAREQASKGQRQCSERNQATFNMLSFLSMNGHVLNSTSPHPASQKVKSMS